MSLQILVTTSQNQGKHVHVDRYPDECPWCHKGLDPVFLLGYLHELSRELFLSFRCTRQDCMLYFVGYYSEGPQVVFEFGRTMLGRPLPKKFSDLITKLSPDFVKIYNQAQIAEDNLLAQIAGPGYKKAFEFLIKDYIIFGGGELKEAIEKKQLGQCIADHISNDTIKKVAKRTVWLSNDESHYVRKWIDKDISDLKKLIDLTLHWIEMFIATEEIIREMPEVGR